MAADADSEEDETFVTLGTPLDVPDEDEPIKKQVRPQDVQPTDSQGRPRFHGAFTGGFSAGYFNSVGSKEGWSPSTFVSSREKRAEEKHVQKPEDFMDEEDLGEYGIAPRKFVAGSQFTSEERRKRRLNEAKQATSDSIIPAEAALLDLIVPERLTVGVKLLRKMGWKEGQGVGPRLSRKQKKKAGGRVYGCALPPSPDSGDDLDDDSFLTDITYAPKDSAHILLAAKDNTKGLGYRGLDPKKALPGTHINLFEPPRISKGGASRKGIQGQGFGVGALEDEDEDIYALDSMSNYDMTMGGAEEDDKFGWTGPSGKRQIETPVGYVGKLLDGFTLSSKKLVQKKDFPPPKLPRDYRPVHRFISKADSAASTKGVDYRQFLKPPEDSIITKSSQEKSQSGVKKTQLRDAVSRSMQLGEQAFVGSVFDLIPERDKDKMVKAKQGTIPGFEASTSQQLVPVSSQEPVRASDTVSLEDKHQKSAPLFHGVAGLFKPFHKDPAKQQRYDRYLELVKIGHKDPYSAVVAAGQTEWEIATEKEEFHKAAKLYRPLAGMMAMRFTRAGHVDDEQVDVKMQQTIDLSDAEKAAEMKMYGKLTRDVLEWHPDSLVCKRFNVPNPYPGSTIVGLATVKRDRYSVFNFLNFSNPTCTEQDLKDQNQTNNKSTEETMDTSEQDSHVDRELNKGKAMKSIFSHLVETEKETQRTTKPVSFTMKSTKSNKPKEFKSIFSHLEKEESKFAGDTKVAVETDKLENKNSEKIVGNTEKDTVAAGINPTEKSEEPTVDLFRAIFRNTDSEDSSSSEEETISAGNSSVQQRGAGDSSVQQRGSGDSSVQQRGAGDSSVQQRGSGGSSRDMLTSEPQGVVEKIMSVQTDISEELSMEDRTLVIAASSASVGFLPGSGKPLESLSARLSLRQESDLESDDPESYGPALPPPNSTGEDNRTYSSSSAVVSEYTDVTKQTSRKQKDKHKHKSKKDKKDKHKKNKHKKKEKKKKGHHDSSDHTGTSDKDTNDDDDDAATDREILNRLKLMKPGHRMRAADFL